MLAIYHRRFGVVWDELSVETIAPDLDIPLLVVHDRSDRLAPFSHGERTCRAWTCARLFETEGLGHLLILQNQAVAGEIAGFLATGRPGSER